jgi:cobalt/nickel transport system permease protein
VREAAAGAPAPAWLLRDEAYVPRPDREAFIDRSTRSLLGLMAMLRRRDGGGQAAGGSARGLVGIDARIGLVSSFLFVFLVSLSRGTLFLACTATLFLVLLSLQRGEVIRDVLTTSLAAAIFTLLIMLPSALWGNAANAARLTVKVLVCAACVRLYSAVTEPRRITRALAVFRVPDVLILVLDTTLRSLVLLGDLALSLLQALRLRSVGRNPDKTKALSGIAGTLFLKMHQMMGDMYAAMECRGFTGSYRAARAARLHVRDVLPLLADCLFVTAFFLMGA